MQVGSVWLKKKRKTPRWIARKKRRTRNELSISNQNQTLNQQSKPIKNTRLEESHREKKRKNIETNLAYGGPHGKIAPTRVVRAAHVRVIVVHNKRTPTRFLLAWCVWFSCRSLPYINRPMALSISIQSYYYISSIRASHGEPRVLCSRST